MGLIRNAATFVRSIRSISQLQAADNVKRSTTTFVPNLMKKSETAQKSTSFQDFSCQAKSSMRFSTHQFQSNANLNSILNGKNQIIRTSEQNKMNATFAALDLASMNISSIGFIGDCAVWAIMDSITGEIVYVVDDDGQGL
ncbi:Oidioi.mRNA.OKI2018_I69.chr2.g4279.t1.cds [Oikopleura dioica]|uniref:Oidioi.mRNA.OKI2018_I69.chr2.g4279.t1.cds n=1 Tax=Oikopleura dioica TaxID=34765 RepID=A0ABN7SWM1_OIKDI|nr:Oidioi.mRNA.OKI2018_I69.chr2.g4279.t1.cds [Oikopleura dioica]